jgi:GMP synthase (glutamine-hydrolysing)
MKERREAGVARRIVRQKGAQGHALLDGWPSAFDAPAVHTDEVEELPPGGTLLASKSVTHVQAAEIRHEQGIFWGANITRKFAARGGGRVASSVFRHRRARARAR